MSARASWLPLIVAGGWNPALRKAFDGRSGAYAIRAKKTRGVQYVGESHTDRGWKTLTRHFQDASGKFAKVRETFVRSTPGDYEAALWVAPKGQKPLDIQAELIERFTKEGHQLVNRDDGKAAAPRARKSKTADDDFAFGANVNPGRPSAARAWAATRAAQAAKTNDAADLLHATAAREHEDVFRSTTGEVSDKHRAASREHALASSRAHERVRDDYDAARDEGYDMQKIFAQAKGKSSVKNPARDWIIFTKGDDVHFRGTDTQAAERAREVANRLGSPVYLSPAEGTDRGVRYDPSTANPSTGAIVLGELVSLKYTGPNHRTLHTMRFKGALLAYVPSTSRLVIVYRPVVNGRASTKGRIEYATTHWGKLGAGDRLEGEVLLGAAQRVGVAREITYATRKGADSKTVDYWHTFGDYGPGSSKRSFIPPTVDMGRVGGRELVRLVGGTYTVTAHGIVG